MASATEAGPELHILTGRTDGEQRRWSGSGIDAKSKILLYVVPSVGPATHLIALLPGRGLCCQPSVQPRPGSDLRDARRNKLVGRSAHDYWKSCGEDRRVR